MKKLLIVLIIMMIISITGCSSKKGNQEENGVVENPETTNLIDNNNEDEYDDIKSQTINENDLPGPQNISDKTDTTDNTATGSSESGQISENLEIEIGEDQNIGGL